MSTKTVEGKTKLRDILNAFKTLWGSEDETVVAYTMSATEAKEVMDSDPNAEVLSKVIKEVEAMGDETQEPVNKSEKKTMTQAGLNNLRSRLAGQTRKNDWKTPEITQSKEKEIVD